MRLPPSVRYLPSRLQIVLNPWLWLGVLIAGIVGIYVWEYRQNPGQEPWQLSSTDSAGNSTSTDALLDSLTSEEQAVAAELDNIELLLSELDSDVSVLTSGGDSSAAASLNAALADTPGSAETESPVARLNRYIDEYTFIGTNARGVNLQTPQSGAAATQQPPESVLTLKPFLTADQNTSVLFQDFNRQLQQPENPSGTANPGNTTTTAEGSASDSTFSFDQTGVVPGTIDGLNRTFIRTTPNMSPPPGTTGYVPPVSVPSPAITSPGSGLTPASPTVPSFGTPVPAVTTPDRSQVLPPATNPVVTPIEIPTVDGTIQTTPQQPRNAWEAFFD
ncbi:MAG: hypothetical protein AAF959_20330 [Cyanobacteria bacterium P01_D01_bin.56]